jgi:hypothetical protein
MKIFATTQIHTFVPRATRLGNPGCLLQAKTAPLFWIFFSKDIALKFRAEAKS